MKEKLEEGFKKIIEELQEEGYTLEDVSRVWKEVLKERLMKD